MDHKKMAEEAVVRHLANAPDPTINALLGRGVTREWFSDPLYRVVVDTGVRLSLNGRRVDAISILADTNRRDGKEVTPERWAELVAIWERPSPPGDLQTFLDYLQDAAALRRFDQAIQLANDLRRQDPKNVRRWISTVIDALRAADDNPYDPRPSTHYQQDLRRVVATFGIPSLDRALRGGIWDGALVLIGGISNHGKSTLAYTLAAACVRQGIRCAFLTTETLPSEVSVGVLRILSGLPDGDVRRKNPACLEHLPEMDRFLSVYDMGDMDRLNNLDRILYWVRPVVVLLDYLRVPEASDSRTPEHQLLARLGDNLRLLSNRHRCMIVGFSQFSASVAAEFRKKRNLGEVTLFGSARLYHASDQVLIMMRHPDIPNTGFFKVKKDRLPTSYSEGVNLLDYEFLLYHDSRTHSFREANVLTTTGPED